MRSRSKTIRKHINKERVLFIVSTMTIPLLAFALLYVYMNFNSFLLSFQKIDIAGNYVFVKFDNYIEFFKSVKANSEGVGKAFFNSLRMWAISFAISMPLYLIFSYYVAKKLFAHNLVSFLVMVPQVVSSFVFALVYKRFVENALPEIMNSWGFENFPNLITNAKTAMGNNLFFSIWLSFGTSVLVYTNAINAIDDEILESARLDGVNDFNEFWNIVLPLIWPTLTTFVVTGVTSIFTWSGSLLLFYMYDAPPKVWGLGYYFTATVKKAASNDFMAYPTVATAGVVTTILTVPVVFFVKWLMNKFDKTE